MYKYFFKRLIDLFIALIVIIILLIPLIFIAILLYFANQRAGVFFFQKRPGKNAKIFKVIKFKTMTDERDTEGQLLPDKDRITRVGRFIRSTSIDELPQLINVLKGDMALIGPRPLLPQYLPLYSKEQARRHEVRPGITGWAQVNGRNHAKLSQKFANDVWYVDHYSFAVDLKIICMTIQNVFNRCDVGEGAADMVDIDDIKFSIRLLKFGSDYPIIDDYKKGLPITSIYPNAIYYACGRQPINDLIAMYRWKRIWMPSYFCYEIIDYIKKSGINVSYYIDYPSFNDVDSIANIDFKKGDVLFRMNYFGIRTFRSNKCLRVPVIEDHSHDLIGDWAKRSDADFCIASLRKSLPISEGGILWSPINKGLPKRPMETIQNNELSNMRYNGMKLKADFLSGHIKNSIFRNPLLASEKMFENLPKSKISDDSWNIINRMDVQDWYDRKHHNWDALQCLNCYNVKILQPEYANHNPFSVVLVFENKEIRDRVRHILIKRLTVFPAILWTIPESQNFESVDFSNRMLSIHCDGRYDNDLDELEERIVTAFKLAKV